MGQTACCESNANKKNVPEENEQNNLINGYNNEINKLNQSQNAINNTDSINLDLNQIKEAEQLKNANTSNLRINQNDIEKMGYSVTSLKLKESLNKNQSTLPNNLSLTNSNQNITTSLNNKLSLRNSKTSFSCIKTFEGHNNKIVSLIELSTGEIVTGSYDATIKIWDINT